MLRATQCDTLSYTYKSENEKGNGIFREEVWAGLSHARRRTLDHFREVALAGKLREKEDLGMMEIEVGAGLPGNDVPVPAGTAGCRCGGSRRFHGADPCTVPMYCYRCRCR